MSVLCISTTFFVYSPAKTWAAETKHPIEGSTEINHHFNLGNRMIQPMLGGINNPLDFVHDRERAHEWGAESYGSWLRELPLTEQRAIDQYSGGEYRAINNYLRFYEGNLGADGVLDPKIQLIDRALRKARTPEAIAVYRRVGETAFGLEANSLRVGSMIDQEKAREFAETFINTTRTEHAYVSTSLVKQPVNVFPILLHITVPQGSHGAYIESISQHPEEMELLLARGYSYRIDGISIITEEGRQSLKVSAKLIK